MIKEGEPPPAEQLNGTHHPVEADGEKAAFWLTHLETEVSRLHAKWHSIDAEFKVREARIAELRDEVNGRDATIAKLTADLRNGADALRRRTSASRAKNPISRGSSRTPRSATARSTSSSTALGGAEERHRALQETLKATQAEVARLDASVRREQEASAGVAKLNEELLADQRRLQGKLQDLETYINGRHQSWSELNAQLADYKDALVGMERTVKARDASVARFDEEKRQLAARILDLERQCSELVGRRKEREAAYDELQKKLAEHFETTEQLKAEHAKRASGNRAGARESRQQPEAGRVPGAGHHAARREPRRPRRRARAAQGVCRRSVRRQRDAHEDASTISRRRCTSGRSRRRRCARSSATSHDQLETLRNQLGERSAQLATSRDGAEEKARLADKLAATCARSRKKRRTCAATSRGSKSTRRSSVSCAARRLRNATASKPSSPRSKSSSRASRRELRAKQATADLLERNVGRITDLGASLAALDRQMDGSEPSRADIHFPDFIETVASDAAGDSDESQEDAVARRV